MSVSGPNGLVPIVKQVLDAGADVAAADVNGMTALRYARKHEEILHLLK